MRSYFSLNTLGWEHGLQRQAVCPNGLISGRTLPLYHTLTQQNSSTFFPLTGGCSEGLNAFRFLFIHQTRGPNGLISGRNLPLYHTRTQQHSSTFSPLTGGCLEGLDAFRFFFIHQPEVYYPGTRWSTLTTVKHGERESVKS